MGGGAVGGGPRAGGGEGGVVGNRRDLGEGSRGRPGVSPALQLPLISQNLQLPRKVPSSHSHLPECREWRMRNLDGSPLLFPLTPCTPGGED